MPLIQKTLNENHRQDLFSMTCIQETIKILYDVQEHNVVMGFLALSYSTRMGIRSLDVI